MFPKDNNPLGDIAKNVPSHQCGKVLGFATFCGALGYGLKLLFESLK